ncbi:hypothetical protein ACFSTE_03730 [Aquimarina hainanensis]|uniref:Uncharacterized protein n=1 Tax=Aquimarina hainanensis TaxID=1578017 RepID=A0ABW5N4A7_9FLAO|nr:hypothetical protein [Aquimarina sp. TRL1]QKX05965.1 hypothetical protein HN014_13960 [Aquimarina sp. TRL1]
MATTTSVSDDKMVIDILTFFYPGEPILEHDLNNELRDLAAEMFAEALDASHLMDLVPRPTYTPSFSWLVKEGVKAVWRSKNDDIYEAVRGRVAINFKSEFHMAKMGI